MNPENLFSRTPKQKPLSSTKNIAIGNALEDKVLGYNLFKNDAYKINKGSQDDIFNWVSQGAVDYALISAADFALLKGGWLLIPALCKANDIPAKSNLLFFNSNLPVFRKIAILKGNNTAHLVLKILMKEIYQLDPEYIETEGPTETLLNDFDAVLVTGERALQESENNKSFIDISEEWQQLTELPLVNGFWIANELSMEKKDLQSILESYQTGIKNINNIWTDYDSRKIKAVEEYLINNVKNSFDGDYLDSLQEMYRYAFFWGLTEYVPDLDFVNF